MNTLVVAAALWAGVAQGNERLPRPAYRLDIAVSATPGDELPSETARFHTRTEAGRQLVLKATTQVEIPTRGAAPRRRQPESR